MSIRLTTWQDGVAVEIDDHKGIARLYQPERVAHPSCWCLRLHKIDPATAEVLAVYTVRLWPDGRRDCTCPDFTHRRKLRTEEGGCKHVLEAVELRRVLDALLPVAGEVS